MNQVFTLIKQPAVDKALLILFGIFICGFYIAPTTKALNIIFYFLVVVPVLLLRPRATFTFLKESPLILAIVGYIAFYLLSLLWQSGEPLHRLDKVFTMSFLTLIYISTCFRYFSHYDYNKLITAIIIASAVASAASLYTIYGMDSFPNTRLQNSVHDLHPILTAQYFGIALFAVAYQLISKKLSPAVILVLSFIAITLLISIILTHSRGPMFSLIVTTIAVGLLTKQFKATFFIILGFTAIALIYWQIEPTLFSSLFDRGSSGRGLIYSVLIDRVGDNYLLGNGINSNDKFIFPGGFVAPHAHSVYMGAYVYGGFIGLGFLLLIIGYALYLGFALYKKTNDWLPLAIMIFGTVAFVTDGQRLFRPSSPEWFVLLMPICLIAANYYKLTQQENHSLVTNSSPVSHPSPVN